MPLTRRQTAGGGRAARQVASARQVRGRRAALARPDPASRCPGKTKDSRSTGRPTTTSHRLPTMRSGLCFKGHSTLGKRNSLLPENNLFPSSCFQYNWAPPSAADFLFVHTPHQSACAWENMTGPPACVLASDPSH